MFKEYTSRLVKAGCEVKVLSSNSGGIEGKFSYHGVEAYYFRWPSFFGHPVPRRGDLIEFVKWSDVVHAATFTAAPVALSVSRKLGRPCLVTVYEALGKKWFWVEKNVLKSLLFYMFEHYVIKKKYSMFHAISFATRRDLISKGINERLIATIYPGISERFLGSGRSIAADCLAPLLDTGNCKVFLYFGRPGKTKGIFVLLDAIRRVKDTVEKGFRFVFILGNDPASENARFKTLVAKYQLSHIVEIIEPLPDALLIQAIKDAFCVLVPSITEGFGYTAAESCALGKPIIASDGGSLPEVVSGKALLFQNRNSIDLSEKILMATRGEFRELPGKHFDWDASTRALLRAYETLIESKRS